MPKKNQTVKKVRNKRGEIWKPIPFTDDRYHASNMGRVKIDYWFQNRHIYHLLRIRKNRKVKSVQFWIDSRIVECWLSRAILMAFADVEGSHLLTVKHIDSNPNNFAPENLCWITRKEAQLLKRPPSPVIIVRRPRVKIKDVLYMDRKSGHPVYRMTKLSNLEIIELTEYHRQGASLEELSKLYNIPKSTMWHILVGRIRSSVSGIIPKKK